MKSRSAPRPPTTPPASARLRAWRQPSIILAVALAIVLLAGGLIFADWYTCLPPDTQATYVGRNSCVQCHQHEASLYAGSHHDLAMDRATDETVLGDFNNAELTYFDVTSRMYRDGEKFMIHTEGPDGKMGDFEVKYVLGVDPLQNYMVEFDRGADLKPNELGRVQVLRIAWDTRKKRWFYLPPPDVDDKLAPDDDLYWTNIAQRWNNMCSDCHSTNVQRNFDPQTLKYHTSFSEIDVSCEACHGPGSTHVKLAKAKSLFWDRNLGYGLTAKLKVASAEPQIQVCAECHARRQVVAGDYDPGDNYWDHFDTELLSRLTYHTDGQIEDEDFEHGSFLQSKMYHKNIRCTDCHDPHTAKLQHEGNKLCTSCHQHPAGKYDTPLHHHHQAGTNGASCVECHMPQTTYMEVHARRDHSIRVPRPDLSVQLGTPNACTACHLDQAKLKAEVAGSESEHASASENATKVSRLKQYLNFIQAARAGDKTIGAELKRLDQWSADAIEKWYGHPPKEVSDDPHFAFALAAARDGKPEAEKLLAQVVGNRLNAAIVRATALTEWGAFDSRAMLASSEKALADPNPQVRAAAVNNLARLPQEERAKLLAPLLADEAFLVRRTAARALADCAQLLSGKQRNQLQLTLLAWTEGVLVNNDRGGAHLAVGSLYEQLRDGQRAEAAYRTALRVEPNLIGPRANLAALLEQKLQQPELSAAERSNIASEITQLRNADFELLARDARLAPNNASVQYRYGLALYLRDDIPGALAALATAVKSEPNVPDFRMAYGLLLQKEGRDQEAIDQMEAILELRPRDPGAAQILAELRRQVAEPKQP
jgi:HEAT repeat protein